MASEYLKEKKKLFKAAWIIGNFTFISRILGYIRDMVMAGFFGAGLYSDVFIAAFRIPNLFRRLFAEGSLTVAFIPVFTHLRKKEGQNAAFDMARSALWFLSVVLAVIAVIGVLSAPWIVHGIAPGFTDDPEQYQLAVSVTRILFPYVFFICLVALCMGILNVLGHFAAPAMAPVLLNVAMITAMIAASYITENPEKRLLILAVGVIVGGILQLGFQIPFLMKQGFVFLKKAPFFHPALGQIGKLMLPALIGAAVYQINIVVGTVLASFLAKGSISALYYADRIVQFPLGIFAISIGTAVMPGFSRYSASEDYEGLKDTFSYGIRLMMFIMIPAAVGLIVLRSPIVALLFKRGVFSVQDVIATADALLYYAVGLVAVSCVRVTAPVFYSMKDTRTPVKTAIISIALNIVLSLVLLKPMGHSGLALATSLASIANCLILLVMLQVKIGSAGWMKILITFVKSCLIALIMGICVHHLALYVIPAYNGKVSELLTGVIVCIVAGSVVYALGSVSVKSGELGSIKKMLMKERNKHG